MQDHDASDHKEPRYGTGEGAHPAHWDPLAVLKVNEDREKTRRVVIVGAGIGGISFAWLLRRRGYRNVVVLERNDHIGGKVKTEVVDGLPHEMGACYTQPSYQAVRELLRMYDLYDIVGVAGRTVQQADGSKMEFGDWVVEQLREELGGFWSWMPSKMIGAIVLLALKKYERLHRRYFGEYDGLLPPRPSDKVLDELNCTYRDWLDNNQLDILIPVLRLFQSAQGYGYLETVPAFYGLMWNNPTTLTVVEEQLKGEGDSANLLRSGFTPLVERMVKDAAIEVRLNQEVLRIRRGDEVHLEVRDHSTGQEHTVIADQLVLTPNLRHSLEWLQDVTDEERALWGSQTTATLSTTLQRAQQVDDNRIDSWFHHLYPGQDHEVMTQRLTRAFLDPDSFARRPKRLPDLRVVYQYGETAALAEDIVAKYDAHYDAFGVKEREVISRHHWDYFPHWTLKGVREGKPWDVLDIQGKNRTWWTGASASFESLNDVVTMNLLIIKLGWGG